MSYILCTMSTNDVQQCRFIVRRKALVQLPHERRLMYKGETADGMDVGKVLLHDTAQVAAGGKTW